MSLRQRRELLGLTQAEVAERTSTSKEYYSQIESGRTRLPSPELRREICRALGMRHVDFLVEQGIIEEWEIPGFSSTQPEPDPELGALMTLLERIELHRNNRGTTLGVVLRQWAEEDRRLSEEPPRAQLQETPG
jgi:transcriptional regulator with XRE-family HTH domain